MKQPHLPEFEPERDFNNCDTDTKAFWIRLKKFEASVNEIEKRIDRLDENLNRLKFLIEGEI